MELSTLHQGFCRYARRSLYPLSASLNADDSLECSKMCDACKVVGSTSFMSAVSLWNSCISAVKCRGAVKLRGHTRDLIVKASRYPARKVGGNILSSLISFS